MAQAAGLYTQDKDESGLTRKQREVLAGLRAGKSQWDLAQEMGVSRQRIRQHVEALLSKGIEIPGVKPVPNAG